MKIDSEVKTQLAAEIGRMFAELSGLKGIVLATVDGFEVAFVGQGRIEASRVAAMASSISAIGTVVSLETRLGTCNSITINTVEGFMFISSLRVADVDLVLNVVAGNEAILAQVMLRTREAVRRMAVMRVAMIQD